MNTPTLKELADIGSKAAFLDTAGAVKLHQDCREAFTKAVLDAVGYKFPVDPEREAFDAWLKEQGGTDFIDMKESMFLSWKAGREELRKEVCSDKCENTKTEPAWIEWKGGPCPIPDTVRRWEYKLGDGMHRPAYGPPRAYADNWEHAEGCGRMYHITAYRVLDWGTTKQPE